MLSEDWQNTFANNLLHGLSDNLSATLLGDHLYQRFAIYQNNVFYSLTTALADLYPVCKQLVGDEFFAGTAHYFTRQYLPQQAAMVNYGREFPVFLTEFEHTKELAWLADIAKLELLYHQSYHAEDCKPLNQSLISNIGLERFSTAKFNLNPSLYLLNSDFPVFSIWQDHQQETTSSQTFSLDQPECGFVIRNNFTVAVHRCDNFTYHFLENLAAAFTIEEAAAQAMEKDHSSNPEALSEAIGLCFNLGLLNNLITND